MHIFTIAILILLTLGCSSKYPEHPNYQLVGEQSGYYGQTDSQGNLIEKFGLKFKLTSKYDTLPAIYLMTCSWTDHASIDNPKVTLGTGCDSNFMWRTSIKTDEYLELTTIARPSQTHENVNLTELKFRVALIAIDTTEIDFGFYLTDPKAEDYLDSLLSQKERFIWSNEIQLERLNQQSQLPWGSWEIKKSP